MQLPIGTICIGKCANGKQRPICGVRENEWHKVFGEGLY